MKRLWQLSRLILMAAILVGLLGITPTARALTGCTIYVGGNGDGDPASSGWQVITLREAILIANGGTGPQGLNRNLNSDELSHIWFCAHSGGQLVEGGAGYVDTIYFDPLWLTPNAIFTLNASQTAFTDGTGDVLDGTNLNMSPIIDASNVGYGLVLGSHVTVKGITVKNATTANILINGNGNLLDGVKVVSGQSRGIDILGNYNSLNNVSVGYTGSDCTQGNAGDGIRILSNNGSAAGHNVVSSSFITCNGGAGVAITGSGADNNILGPYVKIGTNLSTGDIDFGNDGDGVAISAGADATSILTSTLANNLGNGLSIADANDTHIGKTTIRNNSLSGITVGGISYNTLIGGPSPLNTLNGNQIGSNGQHGINLVGSNVRYTLLAGNEIGTQSNGPLDDGNTLNGVMVNGARNNYLGDAYAELNTIGGNQLSGVALTNGASGNTVSHDTIGTGSAPNNLYGIQIDTGAHDNQIGVSPLTVQYSGAGNVLIQGSTTATNTVTNVYAGDSNGFGLALRNGTFNNTIGLVGEGNGLSGNHTNGLEISGGAHHNTLTGNTVTNNAGNGLRLSGGGTVGNVISGTQIISNTYDGLSEGNSANNNTWSHLSFQDNGGLPIDKLADVDTTNVANAAVAKTRSIVAANSVVTITGVASPGSVLTSVRVEVYAYSLPAGKVTTTYLGSVPVSNSGTWTLTLSNLPLTQRCLLVFETTTNLVTQTKASSEFGFSNCRNLLPTVVR